MPVTPSSTVGIVSNPDPRPAAGSASLTVPENWSDPNKNHITHLIGGRVVRSAEKPKQ